MKFKCNSQGGIAPAHPSAPIGVCPSGNASHYEVLNVPEGVSPQQAARLLAKTAVIGGFRVDFSQLGEGFIARASSN
jgi:hypothetical protein